jgi:hypothetical protein
MQFSGLINWLGMAPVIASAKARAVGLAVVFHTEDGNAISVTPAGWGAATGGRFGNNYGTGIIKAKSFQQAATDSAKLPGLSPREAVHKSLVENCRCKENFAMINLVGGAIYGLIYRIYYTSVPSRRAPRNFFSHYLSRANGASDVYAMVSTGRFC